MTIGIDPSELRDAYLAGQNDMRRRIIEHIPSREPSDYDLRSEGWNMALDTWLRNIRALPVEGAAP